MVSIIVHALVLMCLWVCVNSECNFDVDDGSWNSYIFPFDKNSTERNFTFPDPVNNVNQTQCKSLIGLKESSIFILKVIIRNASKHSELTIEWNGKREKVEITPREITEFVDSSQIKICYKQDISQDNTTEEEIYLYYKEMKRDNSRNICSNIEGTIKPKRWQDCRNGSRYLPNAISFWGIPVRNGSVTLSIKQLDIDDYAGDYLLIGSSITHNGDITDVFQGHPPLFLTGKSNKTKNVIVSSTYQSLVYVVLVSKFPKRFDSSGFHITFKADGERIGVASTEMPAPTVAESWKEAVSICATVPKNDSNETVIHNIKSFVKRQALQELSKNPLDISINETQIEVIILIEQRRQEDEYFVMLTVESLNNPNAPLLKAKKLRDIFHSKGYPPEYEILLCDERPFDGEWLKPVTLAFVPIFIFLLLVLWWFQYKILQSSQIKVYQEKPTFQVEMSPPIMVNPAFEPDSPLPCEETELPSPVFNNTIYKKHFNFNENSGFASCSTHPSSAKSSPGMIKRKVLFNIPSKETKRENNTLKDNIYNEKSEHEKEDIIHL